MQIFLAKSVRFRILICLLLYIVIPENLIAGGGNMVQRLQVHFEFKRISLTPSNSFDPVEITAYLVNSDPGYYTDIPDTLHFLASLNGRTMEFSANHKLIVSEPGYLLCGYYDSFVQGVEVKYFMYHKQLNLYNSNRDIINFGSGFMLSQTFVMKPDYKAVTHFNKTGMAVSFAYTGRIPATEANYCYGSNLAYNAMDHEHFYIDHTDWYRNGELLNTSDSVIHLTEGGTYYAVVFSNYGLAYSSDTISFSNTEFAEYSGCLDARIKDAMTAEDLTRNKSIKKISETLKIFPNPVNDYIELNFVTCKEVRAILQLGDLNGITLIHQAYTFQDNGTSNIKLSVADVPSGVYWLSMNFNGIILRHKIIKL